MTGKGGILTELKHLVCLLKESIPNLTDVLLINFTLSVLRVRIHVCFCFVFLDFMLSLLKLTVKMAKKGPNTLTLFLFFKAFTALRTLNVFKRIRMNLIVFYLKYISGRKRGMRAVRLSK